MAKANKSERDNKMTAIVTDAVTDVVSENPKMSEAPWSAP